VRVNLLIKFASFHHATFFEDSMPIVLISNYPLDRQESMLRFARMLNSEIQKTGLATEVWWPKPVFGLLSKSTNRGLGKWLGYIDKWLIFPVTIRYRLVTKKSYYSNARFHVCDHSNAPYLNHLPRNRTAITCHDVIAIRGALGYKDTYVAASVFGRILQKRILYFLSRAKLLACVSNYTYRQLLELSADAKSNEARWIVIHNALNADFRPLKNVISNELLIQSGINVDVPFILHVGSSLQRKNRKLLLSMVMSLGNQWNGNICFAGEAIDNDLSENIKQLGLEKRVVSIEKPNHETLVALYSTCAAFIFPSFSEGFGWPIIEAQACGTPVIASAIEPFPEISGKAALFADPNIPQDFAQAFLSLSKENTNLILVQKGLQNANHFKPEIMTKAYIDLLFE
jgi:glycosyltransferase involved in cell wall biosynthesis